jgi:patatin-like phospholipase/acyl hydrolase
MSEIAPDGANSPFRILSLDGGGIKGTFTAAFLAMLESMTHKRVFEHFDLVTGTSTGGIIAVALGLGVPAADLLKLYMEQGPKIFPIPRPGLVGWLAEQWRHLMGPKHSQEILLKAVKGVLGERKLGESRVRLVIPAFDGNRGGVQLFKTAHSPDYKQDYLRPAATVAVGTAAAPTYFQAYTEAGGGCYLDGGLWANSPVVVGLLEATCVLGQRLDEVELLSVGTTSCPYHVSHARRRGGIFRWATGLAEVFMQAQVEAAQGQARLMTRNRMLRVDAVTSPGRFSLDNAAVVAELKDLGEQAARQNEKEISRRFFSTSAAPFTPFYGVEPAAA